MVVLLGLGLAVQKAKKTVYQMENLWGFQMDDSLVVLMADSRVMQKVLRLVYQLVQTKEHMLVTWRGFWKAFRLAGS
jgi:hypothetical protein